MKELLKSILRPFYTRFIQKIEERRFRKRLLLNKDTPLKIVVGSSGIFEEGWIPSEAHFLNLLEGNGWLKYFKENEIEFMLAEHVWEHLTQDQGKKAAATCFRFLKKGGRLRVAVPDGFHANQDYIDYVKPGGSGAGADDHKVLYNYKTFSGIFRECGFKVELLEYFDENTEFHANDWDSNDGYIHRSIRFDTRNADGLPHYTSLILDAIKP